MEQFRAALAAASPSLPPARLASTIADKVAGLPSEDVPDLVDLLLSLYAARAALELSVDEFVEALLEAVGTIDLSAISDRDRSVLVRELQGLLSLDSLDAESRAIDILYEQPNVFQAARILTDIRPVFGAKVEDRPRLAVISHTLKIVYRQGAELKEFFVSLDPTDIGALSAVLARATQKESTLQALLRDSGIAYLTTEGQ